MVPLFQQFEFSYRDGALFYDRSGLLARRLQRLMPNLQLREGSVDQRNLSSSNNEVDLFFGIGLARIQTVSPGILDFPELGSQFLATIAETLEVGFLSEFHFRNVIGKACHSNEEAQDLMEPVVPEETKTRLLALAKPPHWRGLQFEYVTGNLAITGRVAVLDLIPNESGMTTGLERRKPIPHITFHIDVRGLAPIAVAELDAKAFIQNICQSQTTEILSKIAPHLAS